LCVLLLSLSQGSGKTTLLDAVAGRIGNSGKLLGEIYVNGRKLKAEQFQDCFSYVPQSDNLLSYLTVEETLTYTAQLSLRKHSSEAIRKKVAAVMAELSLGHVAHSVIGGRIFPGISVGERRRVSIASQLLQDPIELTSVDRRCSEREAATYSRMHDITSAYQSSKIYKSMLGKIGQSCQRADKPMIPFRTHSLPNETLFMYFLLSDTHRRTVRNMSRDRMGILMRLSQNLIYGLFIAFFLMKLDEDVTKGAVQDRIGIIYQSMGASPYTGMLNAVALCEYLIHSIYLQYIYLHLLCQNTYMCYMPDVVNALRHCGGSKVKHDINTVQFLAQTDQFMS
uniref:ATP-binding cassette, sub-family G (WHITE), member 5 n=1 Tax=Cyprinus carpio TaxID=7962 RepID=A0A8C2L8R8_CYPCA